MTTTNWACPRCGAVVSSRDDHQCDDIVARLRWLQNDMMGQHSITAKEAADEIERQRQRVLKLESTVILGIKVCQQKDAEIEGLQLHIDEQDSEIDRLRDDNAKLRGEIEVLLHMRERREAPTNIVEINCEHDWTQIDHNGDRLMWPICSECGALMPPHLEAPTPESDLQRQVRLAQESAEQRPDWVKKAAHFEGDPNL